MRIHKLAQDLGVSDGLIVQWLREAGQIEYKSGEQQLPERLIQLIRLKARQARTAPPPPPPPPPSAPSVSKLAPDEKQLLTSALAGVRPIAKHSSEPQQASAELFQVRRQLQAAQQERAQLQARAEALHAQSTAQRAELAKLTAALEQARQQLAATEQERDSIDQHRRSLQQSLQQHLQQQAELSPRVALRDALMQRGLRGDDEMSLALRGLLEQHREKELFPLLETSAPEQLQKLLQHRLFLAAEEDDAPQGVAVVRVPADRSEGDPPSAIREAMARFSTVCLVNNYKRIVIVGGSPAYHKALRDGMDRRLQLRLVPGDGRVIDVPEADITILWAATILDHRVSERFPHAIIVPVRGLVRMLLFAAERVNAQEQLTRTPPRRAQKH